MAGWWLFHARASAKWPDGARNELWRTGDGHPWVDAHSGKRRNTAVRQFPDVITGPCSRAKRPGLENPEILLYSPWRTPVSCKEALLLSRFFFTSPRAPLAKARERTKGMAVSCLTPAQRAHGEKGENYSVTISNIQGTGDILNVPIPCICFSAGYWKRHASREISILLERAIRPDPSRRVPCAESIK